MKKILVSMPEGVFKLIVELEGEIGESKSEVVRNIVVAYLSDQGYFSRMGAIKGILSSDKRKRN
jgi:metal-responsive CopG/Arc/MetJ family transcriptional regulator